MPIEQLEVVGVLGVRRGFLHARCEVEEIHQHNHAHTLIVIQGQALARKFRVDGDTLHLLSEVEVGQGGMLEIEAWAWHQIKQLTDTPLQFLCAFAHRDWADVVTETFAGNMAAYL